MITIKQAALPDGTVEDVKIDSAEDEVIEANGKLLLLPALIDPHVHFRTPGQPEKEDWTTAAVAAVNGGVTTVFDMPNNSPPAVDLESLEAKLQIIEQQLSEGNIPLRYKLWLGADKEHFDDIGKVKDKVIGLKIYMGSSTGGLLMDDDDSLDRAFQIAAQHNLIVAVHAEDEEILKQRAEQFSGETDPSVHSKIRDRRAAIAALKQAIELTKKYSGQLYVVHVSTKEEMDLIREAKRDNILVYAEVTPHHLYLNESHYEEKGTFVQVNPPIRTKADNDALFEAIQDGTVDTIGTDHAPHTIEEKKLPYGKAPSGLPSIEFLLPLLLHAKNEGKISLEKIVQLTRINPTEIFRLKPNHDYVLVDLDLEKTVTNEMVKSKCGWSPYAGMKLKGWPVYTILKGRIYAIR